MQRVQKTLSQREKIKSDTGLKYNLKDISKYFKVLKM